MSFYVLCIVVTAIHFKIKYDEKEKQKAIYYKETDKYITLYLERDTQGAKHNQNITFHITLRQLLWEVL